MSRSASLLVVVFTMLLCLPSCSARDTSRRVQGQGFGFYEAALRTPISSTDARQRKMTTSTAMIAVPLAVGVLTAVAAALTKMAAAVPALGSLRFGIGGDIPTETAEEIARRPMQQQIGDPEFELDWDYADHKRMDDLMGQVFPKKWGFSGMV